MGDAFEMKPPGFNTYWRLEYPSSSIEQLHDQVESKTGHRLPENTTRLHLCEVLGRFERQALDYNKCTRDELCKFVLQRKLAGKEDVKWTKEQLVEVLETADEDRTFNFMGLSPELRCQVYALYIEPFPRSLTAPSQPPLARTCKLVGTEILPLFYQTFQFHFRMECWGRFSYDMTTYQFLAKLHYKHLRMIRNFYLDVDDRHFEMKLKASEKGPKPAVYRKGVSLRAHDHIAKRIERYLLRIANEHANGKNITKNTMFSLPDNLKKAWLDDTAG